MPAPPAPAAPPEKPQPPARPTGKPAAESAPQRALRKLGLVSDTDLALHLPLRHVDETRLQPINSLREGETGQVQGVVREARVEARGRRQLVVRLADDSGELTLRLLHFYPSQLKALAPGRLLRVRGELRGGFFGREMVHPEIRVVEADTPLPRTLTPVYPTTAQLPQAYLRKAVAGALARAPLHEILPPALLPPGLPTLREAVLLLHHPPPGTPLAALEQRSHPAWTRLKFEELLAQQLSQAMARAQRARQQAPVLKAPGSAGEGPLTQALRAALPFALTGAQQRVVAEIAADLQRPQPMHRLLQGDVGSGKTVVAALAAAQAIDAGWQCALMAPTEILAEQHFRKLVAWLQPLGLEVAWLTGSRKGKARREALERVADGRAPLVVGTHAVIQDDVAFARLGLAIVDEQHRFGVAQRLALRRKLEGAALAQPVSGGSVRAPGAEPGGDGPAPGRPKPGQPPWGVAEPEAGTGGSIHLEPHLLMMSATPIPRTLAMSHFADLDLSTLDELPPGRTPVATRLFADERRAQVVARVRDEIAAGRQAYWVCPLVQESEHIDLQNATETHAMLAAALPGVAVGLLHGQMPAAEKADTMARFAGGALRLLVATTVIEVGVDVPQASLMVIEHAERFGLAQLHQLRGRVGRGATASICVLLYTAPLSMEGKARLQAMVETQDGFEIARRDLDIRGPGEFLGARQSGDALLRFADLLQDEPLLRRARDAAAQLLRQHPAVAQAQVQRWLAGRAEFLKA